MKLSFRRTTRGLLLVAVTAAISLPGKPPYSAKFESFPQVTLWAWERPEDLRSLGPSKYAVAYLDQTIFLTTPASNVPRMQPLRVSPGMQVMAVVRIDERGGSARLDDPQYVAGVAELVALSTRRPGVSALQIDFDALRSQRGFYRALVMEVRRRMPTDMPLSMTALASWCGGDDWIRGMPVDEAVPMFFRMGREHPPAERPGWSYDVREPLCRSSAGVSTDEAWPRLQPGVRLYVFHPRPWNAVAMRNLEETLNGRVAP